MKAPLLKVFMARYVVLAEIAGYIIAVGLLALWGSFWFIRLDEHCYASGPIRAAVLEMSTDVPAVLEAIHAENGAAVRKDQALFELNRDPKAIAARQAQADLASLGKQVLTLTEASDQRANLERDVRSLVSEVGALATGQDMLTVTAPEDGRFDLTGGATTTLRVVHGKLGQVVSGSRLQVEAELGELNRARVEIGQKAKIRVILSEDQAFKGLMGEVVRKTGAKSIVVEAPVPDPIVAERLARQIGDPSFEAGKAEVKVVVGNVRLVTYLFQKKATPKPKEEKPKEAAAAEDAAGSPPPESSGEASPEQPVGK